MQLTRRPDANYDMTFGQGLQNFAADSESVRLNIFSRLRVMLGEWFLDTTQGVGYVSGAPPIFSKPADLPFAQAQIKACILGTDGVVSIDTFTMSWNQQSRLLSIAASYTDEYGTSQNIEV